MYTYTHFSDTLCVNPSGTPLDTLSPVEARRYCGSMSTVKDIISDVKEAKAFVAAREHNGGSSATALHCSSPCKDQKVVTYEGKRGVSILSQNWASHLVVLLSCCPCLSLPSHVADFWRRSIALSIPRHFVAPVHATQHVRSHAAADRAAQKQFLECGYHNS